MKINRFVTVKESLDGTSNSECCPQCGSLGVVHFDDPTTTENESPHKCLRCDWGWEGCLFSDGITPTSRLNNIQQNSS
mgnify:FL=1